MASQLSRRETLVGFGAASFGMATGLVRPTESEAQVALLIMAAKFLIAAASFVSTLNKAYRSVFGDDVEEEEVQRLAGTMNQDSVAERGILVSPADPRLNGQVRYHSDDSNGRPILRLTQLPDSRTDDHLEAQVYVGHRHDRPAGLVGPAVDAYSAAALDLSEQDGPRGVRRLSPIRTRRFLQRHHPSYLYGFRTEQIYYTVDGLLVVNYRRVGNDYFRVEYEYVSQNDIYRTKRVLDRKVQRA